ncbi:MAG: DNA-directed RNA polymerase subunit B, partial [Candidatus Micrarchaeia archaeon]
DPVGITSVVVSQLPMQEYNLSVRNTMAASMFKQSIGIYRVNYNLAFDTRSYVMYYPQKPIVESRVTRDLELDKRIGGENLVVALVCYEGYNMMDGVVLNKGAVERGMMRNVMFRTYETEERRYPGGQRDKFEIPPPTLPGYRGEEVYKFLDEDGLVSPNVPVKGRDVLVGKTSPLRFLEETAAFGPIEEKRRENSLSLKPEESGVVDKVILTQLPSGEKLVKIRIRDIKIPENGDKFASRHGQKGVVGLIEREEDLPFTESGIVPDLILNPHAIPSRMTAGHLLEMLGCKAACITGKYVDATPFSGDKLEKFIQELKSLGFDEWGEEEMYDGVTGEKIKVKIFIGVIYYQRLHHLVSNKMHSRTKGPVQLLTSQPTEGRSREGGLRFGEMERDTLLGYGAAATVIDRLLENSDKHVEHVCLDCGSFAYYDEPSEEYVCPVCGSNNVGHIEIPYAFKLLLNEIISMHIYPKLFIRKQGDLDDEQTI